METPFVLLKFIAKALANALGGGIAGDLLIEVLPEVAKDAWNWWSEKRQSQQQRAELEAIVQAEGAKIRQYVAEVVQEVAADQPPEVRQTLEDYLNSIPTAIRRSLRRPTDPIGTTVPATLAPRKAEDLLRLLPPRLPRFQVGDYPLPGTDWELEQLLGVGGFGEVWKARNPHMPDAPAVALKFCLDSVAAKALRNEVALLNRVMQQGYHPGIVQLLNTHLRAEPPCLVYEYVAGGDLGGLIRDWQRVRGGLTAQEAAGVILRLAEIVAVAHRTQPPIVHRDLKPANILVLAAGKKSTFKITDFGIGGVAAEQARRETQHGTSSSRFQVSAVQGSYTPLYASPQQMHGDPPDQRDDVYALGVIWYQLLTGDLSMSRPGGTKWIRRLIDGGAPPALVELLAACFEEEEEDRPADAGVLVDALTNALAPALVSTAALPPATSMAARPQTEQPAPPQPASPAPAKPESTENRSLLARAQDWLGGTQKTLGGKEQESTSVGKTQAPAIRPPIKFGWVTIPAGEFWMGSRRKEGKPGFWGHIFGATSTKRLTETPIDFDAFLDYEFPQHRLYLPEFRIARLPVTVAQFEQFANVTGYKTTGEQTSSGYRTWRDPGFYRSDQEAKHPVPYISWHDAMAFCEWAGVRLPTEAEWEKAARGTDGRIYPWGNAPPDESHANFGKGRSNGATTPVDAHLKGASPYGCLDMAGNVWEWTSSLWGKSQGRRSSQGKPQFGYPYNATDGRENIAAPDKVRRVLRGGSFSHDRSCLRCAVRFSWEPNGSDNNFGFRVVCCETR